MTIGPTTFGRRSRKLALLCTTVVVGAITAGAALGTPPSGFIASVVGRGTYGDEAATQAAYADMVTGVRWYGRDWRPDDLPAFQRVLLDHGVRDLVDWAKQHPIAAIKAGIAPLTAYPGKQIAIARGTMQPGGYTGFHHHPVPEIAVVMSGELTIYRVSGGRCIRMYRVGPGQAGVVPPNQVMFARNEGSVPVEQFTLFLGIPAGTATSFDEPNPGTCPELSR